MAKAWVNKEDSDHRALVRRFRAAGLFFEHPPLGGERSKDAGMAMQALGAIPGSPDFRIYDIPPRYPLASGAAWELKREDGLWSAVAPAQRRFLADLSARAWLCGWGGRTAFLAWLRWLGYRL